ncbi:unnamed protein product [marine sediment metagenome]|uniref:Uncharacterized protein n=1 Tax=marine sediment metagenome TaxID=412755 RepID=X1UWX1_9ZZZZ
MLREAALSATHLDWDRELCKMGCSEWLPWYRNKKGEIVNGCRLGAIPQKVNGQWYCQHRKTTKQKGDKAHA